MKDADQAPIYFKVISSSLPFFLFHFLNISQKAITESESEWAQHKKLIDTRVKGLKRSVPKGFPYFAVEFSDGGGFAHVIEDEKSWKRDFGRV
jgi:hypothetical protein